MSADPSSTTARPQLTVVGGGLAGSEAAWAAAERGLDVLLLEMRPVRQTPAHRTTNLAELVCSNSLGSVAPDRAAGLLQEELARLGSLVLAAARATRVPAGGALAVDREAFAEEITRRVAGHPRIHLERREAERVPDGLTVIATGPLTSDALATDLERLAGTDYLYFFDALSPIVEADSIDMSVAFRASRYGRGTDVEGDYINCPLDGPQYDAFIAALVSAERIELRDFEASDPRLFEGCLPLELLAARGHDSLAFGPLRPVGLRDPRTGKRPRAVVQLRQDDRAGSLYNLVGFQTNLRWPEQRRVFTLIPGLENARFVRLGQMHRNTYINAPALLDATMRFRARPDLFLAGQLVGIEGYLGNAASGLVAGVSAARVAHGLPPIAPPPTTMIGALADYVAHAAPEGFQPMKANFGLLPELSAPPRRKAERRSTLVERARADLAIYVAEATMLYAPVDSPAALTAPVPS